MFIVLYYQYLPINYLYERPVSHFNIIIIPHMVWVFEYKRQDNVPVQLLNCGCMLQLIQLEDFKLAEVHYNDY